MWERVKRIEYLVRQPNLNHRRRSEIYQETANIKRQIQQVIGQME